MSKNKNRPAAQDLIPGDVYHPGEFLNDEMEARGIKQIELADKLGVSKSEVSLMINGKRNISIHNAMMLESILGIKADTWMNLQVKYDINKLKEKYASELSNESISEERKAELERILQKA